MLNGVATVVTEITLLQYLAFYNKVCANGFSTGSGIGGIIGATWALLMVSYGTQHPIISILTCLIFPTVLIIAFMILPSPVIRRATTLEDLQKINSAENAEDDVEFDGETISFCRFLKYIFMDFWIYSLPLFGSYFGYELISSGFVPNIWPRKKNPKFKNFYTKFNWCFRLANTFGKMSTNLWSTKKYWIFPGIIWCVAVFMMILYFIPTGVGFKEFLRGNVCGDVIVLIILTLPLGFCYGSTSSNVYYAIRQDVDDIKLREFGLGNVRQVSTYGQLLGTVVSLLFK